MVFGATLIGIILTLYLWRELAHRELGYWLLMIFLSAVLRSLVFRAFKSSPWSDEEVFDSDHSRWGILFWLTSIIAGSIWGVLPLLFSSELTSENLLLISTIFAGMVAVTASAGNIYPPAYYSFALPLVIPLIFLELLSGNDVLVVTAIMLILYILVNILLVRRGHRRFVELVEARYENANLIDRLNAEKEIAERAVEIKNRFMAAASHDLRQPLHALGLFIGSLRKRESDKERLEIIDDIEASTTSLSQLLHGLLDLSRLDAGVVTPVLKAVLFEEIADKLYAEYSVLAEHKNLSLKIEHRDVVLYTDPMLLGRVLRNLLSNAIAYTSAGSVQLTVEFGSKKHADILITDTGPGISAAARDFVFQEYYRSESVNSSDASSVIRADREATGMGLGLSIVQRLCLLLDIVIEVDTVAGSSGTVFRLKVPVTSRSPESPVIQPSSQMKPLPATHAERCVLVIDDDFTVRKSLSRWLSDQGIEVIEVGSGKDALRALAQAAVLPDLILCDFRLKNGENGIDTVAALREAGLGAISAVIISGDTSPEVLRQVADSGMPLLHKPVSETALYDLLVAELAE